MMLLYFVGINYVILHTVHELLNCLLILYNHILCEPWELHFYSLICMYCNLTCVILDPLRVAQSYI